MNAPIDVGPGPRLSAIERPRGALQWLLRLYFRLRFGKVMMALRVVYPRIPGFTMGQIALARFSQRGLSLPGALSHLIALRVSQRNGCAFCGDLEKAAALSDGHPAALLDALDDFEHSPLFDRQARAALRYADEVVRTHDASDATFDALCRVFDERQVTEIVWLVAFTCYHNLMAKPLRLPSDDFCSLIANRTA